MEEQEEKQFPIHMEQCPNCGSLRRVAMEVLNKEHEAGKAMVATTAFLFQHQSLIAPPGGQFLSATVIVTWYDVCYDCGTVYCIHADTKVAVKGMGNQGKQSPPLSMN